MFVNKITEKHYTLMVNVVHLSVMECTCTFPLFTLHIKPYLLALDQTFPFNLGHLCVLQKMAVIRNNTRPGDNT